MTDIREYYEVPDNDWRRLNDILLDISKRFADVAELYHWGEPNTDGSWRITRDGDDLIVERRESGTWVEKTRVSA